MTRFAITAAALFALPPLACAAEPSYQRHVSAIFSKLTQYGYGSWAVLEWECALKDSVTGAREGAEFIAAHIIPVSATSLDAYMKQQADEAACRRALGLDR